MNDFFTYDIVSNLTPDTMLDQLSRALPGFDWRRGSSDAEGPYIKGKNADSIEVEVWLGMGDEPVAMSVSFRRAWPGAPDRDEYKQQLVDHVERALLPSLGALKKKRIF